MANNCSLRTCALPEHLRGVFTTRRYSIQIHVYLTLPKLYTSATFVYLCLSASRPALTYYRLRMCCCCHCSGTTSCMSASLESIGLADVRLLVKLMCLLAVGRVPKCCLPVSPASAAVSLMPRLSLSMYSLLC